MVRRVLLTSAMTRPTAMTVLLCLSALAGCDRHASSADDVNRPGNWRLSYQRLEDMSDPPYYTIVAAPEYPTRTLHAPHPDNCSPGCDCSFDVATDDCSGDVTQLCRATVPFSETCAARRTLLDCRSETFDSDEHTVAICTLEDTGHQDEFGFRQIARYEITFDRLSYE